MNRLVRSVALVSSVWALGCGEPCYDPNGPSQCTGSVVIDMSEELPSFRLEGLGEVEPSWLEVRGDADCDGAGPAVWEVDRMRSPLTEPIRYSRHPDGARELVAPVDLVDGTTYLVSFWAGSSSGTAGGNNDWTGFFVAGDPDSAAMQSEHCP